MEGGGKVGGTGEGGREGGEGGSEGGRRGLVVVRGGGRLACSRHSHRPSSSFVVVVHQRRPSSLFVVGGGRRSSLASGGGRFRSSVVVRSLSAFADARRRSWVAGMGAPRRRWACLGCGPSFCDCLGVCRP